MMDKYARIENSLVMEILQPVPGFTLAESFPADIVAACVPCGDEVCPGWTSADREGFAPPVDSEAPRGFSRLAEITARLTAIDMESIRPLRAVADGSVTDFEREKLARLETEAAELRAEMAALAK